MTQWTSPSSWEIVVEMTYEKKSQALEITYLGLNF